MRIRPRLINLTAYGYKHDNIIDVFVAVEHKTSVQLEMLQMLQKLEFDADF
jgi:hypothetical protein